MLSARPLRAERREVATLAPSSVIAPPPQIAASAQSSELPGWWAVDAWAALSGNVPILLLASADALRDDDFEVAAALLEEALAQVGDHHGLAAEIEAQLAENRANRGDHAAAVDHSRAAVERAEQARDPGLLAQMLAAQGIMAFFHGERLQQESMARAIELEAHAENTSSYERLTAETLDAHRQTGDVQGESYGLWLQAFVAARDGDLIQARAKALDAIAIAHRCKGLLLAARGEIAGGIDEMEAALADHARRPLPLEVGRTLLEKGTLERRARRKRAAKQSLERALAILEPLRAATWIPRARDELGRVGLRGATAGEGLTPAQQRVAELVTAGLSNREIADELYMSLRTVETHLTKVYRELGVRGRAQLIATMSAAGAPQDAPAPAPQRSTK